MDKKLKNTSLDKLEGEELQAGGAGEIAYALWGSTIYGFKVPALGEAVGLGARELKEQDCPLVRVHSQCLTGMCWLRCAAIAGHSWNCR